MIPRCWINFRNDTMRSPRDFNWISQATVAERDGKGRSGYQRKPRDRVRF
jgi:hypothetical protein